MSLGMTDWPIILIILFMLFYSYYSQFQFAVRHFLIYFSSLSQVYWILQSLILTDQRYYQSYSSVHSYLQFSQVFKNQSVSILFRSVIWVMLLLALFAVKNVWSDYYCFFDGFISFREQMFFYYLICLVLSLISSIFMIGFLFYIFVPRVWLLLEDYSLGFFYSFSWRFYLRRMPSQSFSFSKRIFQRLDALLRGWEEGRAIEVLLVQVEGRELIEGRRTGTKTVLSFFII